MAGKGVTIMCDGWSSMTRYNIINFLIYPKGITVYHKSVDASYLNVDGQEEDDTINIEDDEDRQLGVSPPFRYSTYSSGSGGNLKPPSNRDGSGDGGMEAMEVQMILDINPNISDHNGRRCQEYQEETIAYTYRRLIKAKDKQPKHHLIMKTKQRIDWGPSSNPSYPSYPNSEPHFNQSNPSGQSQDNFQVFNHGTINYRDHHYYCLTIHGEHSSSNGRSLTGTTSLYFFHEQEIDTSYTTGQSEDNNYQEPPHRLFWW
ncbi:hypothetical protein Cgig2_004647 [Carnegiea gigantea]|uniref:DUF659 domain-containing protein n=1 Tax=Carnegiea gigantea TaxID=171969 RepID=A0A9Q1K5K3_9CARY|nr:hypothetical protein Cgig2_004647 [Carnegiea gigantea]